MEVKYKSITQKFKKAEDLQGLKDLNLTPKEYFQLRDIYELNNFSIYLKSLIKIDLSGNYVSKLILKKFPNVTIVLAAENMINECNLFLPKLQVLNLSSNLLKTIPNLVQIPELVNLNLSRNLIESISLEELNPVKKNLQYFDVSFNKINFSSITNFISFVDGLKFFNIKEFSIQGNEFIDSNEILANSYKTLIVISLKDLVKINGEDKEISNDLINEDEIKKQMILEQYNLDKNKKAYYEEFSQVYNNEEKIKKIVNLKMTQQESFLLSDKFSLNNYKTLLANLKILNVSNNLIKEIILGEEEDLNLHNNINNKKEEEEEEEKIKEKVEKIDDEEEELEIEENYNFNNLERLICNNNQIEYCHLIGLEKLIELNLSFNNLKKIPDLTRINSRNLKNLLLNNNKIEVINFENILVFSQCLTILNLSNNNIHLFQTKKINLFLQYFEVFLNENRLSIKLFKKYKIKYEPDLNNLLKQHKCYFDLNDLKNYNEKIYEKVIPDFDEFTRLKNLRLDENPFMKDKDISLLIQNKFAGKKLFLNGIDMEKISTQEETNNTDKSFENLFSDENISVKKEDNLIDQYFYDKKFDDDKSEEIIKNEKIEDKFIRLNEILEKLISFNGENQILYFKFLNEINQTLLISNFDDLNKENLLNLYNVFLMNCNELLSLNQIYEPQILKTLAQLALQENLGITGNTFKFFKLYVESNEEKKQLVKDIIEKIIIANLQLNSNISFDMISKLIEFFKKTNISIDILYKRLILNIVKYISTKFIIDNDNVKFNKDKLNYSNPKNIMDDEKENKYINCLDFVIEYLKNYKNEIEEKKNEKIINGNNENKNNYNNDEDNEEKNINEYDNKSELSEDNDYFLTDENIIFEKIYFDNISNSEDQKYLIGINKNKENYFKGLIDSIEILNNQLNAGQSKNTNYKIFNNKLLDMICNEHNLTNINKLPLNIQEKYEYFSYFYLFLNIFKHCYEYLCDSNYFKKLINEKRKEKYIMVQFNKYFKVIELLNSLLDSYDESYYKYNYILRFCDINSIIKELNLLVDKVILEKNETNNFEKLILKYIFGVQINSLDDDRYLFYEKFCKKFKDKIPYICRLLGNCICFLDQINFCKKLDDDLMFKFFKALSRDEHYIIIISTCYFMEKILSYPDFYENEIVFIKLFQNCYYFKFLLNYIDENKKQFKDIMIKIFKENENDKMESNEIEVTFENLMNPEVFKFFLAILDIFLIINKYNLILNNDFLKKQKIIILNELNPNYYFDVLSNCLRIIKNDEIRIKAIECIYYSDFRYLTVEIIEQILNIINKYLSATEGETEYVLMLIYFTLTNKLILMYQNKEDVKINQILKKISENENNNEELNKTNSMILRLIKNLRYAVSYGMKLLYENTERNPPEIEELNQKNGLSLALLSFLTTASKMPELYKNLFDTEKNISYNLITKILNNDNFFLNSDYYYPLDIERSYLGYYLIILFENMEGINFIKPYTYTFLRILMKISDVVCNCTEFSYESLSRKPLKENINELHDISNKRINTKIENETRNWYHFSTNCQNNVKFVKPKIVKGIKEDNEFIYNKDYYEPNKNVKDSASFELKLAQNKSVTIKTKSSDNKKVTKNKKKKIVDNSKNEFIFDYTFPKSDTKNLINQQINYLIYFSNLFDFLLGKKSIVIDSTIFNDLKKKFYLPILYSETIYETFNTYQNFGNIKTIIGNIRHYEHEITFSSPISNIVINKLKDKNIDSYFKSSNLISYDIENLQDSLLNNNNIEGDMVSYELYGLKKNAKRYENEENVHNPHLRSLIISCFLRSVYALLISPSIKLRNEFIENLFFDDKYKNLLLYSGTQRLYANYNMYIIIEQLFKTLNIKIILKACDYHEDEEIKEKSKKIINLQKNIFKDQFQNEEKNLQAELFLFHTLYITSLYFEREIIQHKTSGLSDLLFMLTFERSLYTFLNFYNQINFYYIDNFFTNQFIIVRLMNSYNLTIIFKAIQQINNYSKYTFNTLKELKKNYDKLSIRLLYKVGIGELPLIVNYYNTQSRKLTNFLAKNEIEKLKILDLLALCGFLNDKLKDLIIYKTLNLKYERENILNLFISDKMREKLQKDDNIEIFNTSYEDKVKEYNDFQEKKKEENKIDDIDINTKTPGEINHKDLNLIEFQLNDFYKNLNNNKYKNQIIKNKFKINDIRYFAIYETFFCTVQNILDSNVVPSQNLEFEHFCAISESQIIFYPIDDDENIVLNTKEIQTQDLNQSSSTSINSTPSNANLTTAGQTPTNGGITTSPSGDSNNNLNKTPINNKSKNIKLNNFEINIKDLECIILYDFPNKIIFESQLDTKIAILVESSLITTIIIKALHLIVPDLKVYKSNTLNNKVLKFEATDKIIRQTLNERSLKNVEKDVGIIRRAQKIVLDKLSKNEKNIFLTNSIEENLYPTIDRDYYSNENTFYCHKQKKILHFSQFKIYIFIINDEIEKKVKKKNDKTYEPFINYFNDEVEFNKDLYKKIDEIFYSEIYNITNDWINFKLEIEYYKGKKTFEFADKFSLYLLNIHLCNIDVNGYEKKLSKNKKTKKMMDPIENLNEENEI